MLFHHPAPQCWPIGGELDIIEWVAGFDYQHGNASLPPAQARVTGSFTKSRLVRQAAQAFNTMQARLVRYIDDRMRSRVAGMRLAISDRKSVV